MAAKLTPEQIVIRKWKIKARTKFQRAVSQGKIVRPNVCTNCDTARKPEAHHEDYNYPLKVVWLCKQCHVRHHNNLNDGWAYRVVKIKEYDYA